MTALGTVADDRAVRMAALLRPDRPDLRAIGREVLGTAENPVGPDGLRAIVRLVLPSGAEVEAIAARLEECRTVLARDSTADAEADLRVLDLLRRARDHVGASGECACPVCGRGELDATWLRGADASIAELTSRVDALASARAALRQAVRDARALPAVSYTHLTLPTKRIV